MKQVRTETIQKVYAKYQLNDPLPADARRAMRASKRKVLLAIYKKNKHSSLFLWLVLTVFFAVKRCGITLTIGKSAAAVIIASLLGSMVLITGSYFAATSLLEEKEPVAPAVEEHVAQQKEPAAELEHSVQEAPVSKVPAYKLGVVQFDYETIAPALARQITRKIVAGINRVKGPRTAGMVENTQHTKNIAKVLMGSIVQVDTNILVTVKIMDPRSLKIISYFTEEAASASQLDQVATRIAARLAREI